MAILCKYIAVVRFQKVFGWRKHAQKARFTSQVLVEQDLLAQFNSLLLGITGSQEHSTIYTIYLVYKQSVSPR